MSIAFIVATKTAVVQITAGSSLLLIDEDFKHHCFHDHLSKCDSCEELTVLQSVEGKVNELSSSMYSKEQHYNLLYDFGKSVNFINE